MWHFFVWEMVIEHISIISKASRSPVCISKSFDQLKYAIFEVVHCDLVLSIFLKHLYQEEDFGRLHLAIVTK